MEDKTNGVDVDTNTETKMVEIALTFRSVERPIHSK